MKIVLKPGDELRIELEGSDGGFDVVYGPTSLDVSADLEDSEGRVGLVYSERYVNEGEGDEEYDGDEADDDEEEDRCSRCNRYGCVCINVDTEDKEVFRCPIGDCDADSPEDCCTSADPIERRIGFWTANEPAPDERDLDLPWPRANKRPFVGQDDFVEALNDLELEDANTKVKSYRGFSRCRCCGKMNGSKEYSRVFVDNGNRRIRYTWPGGYSHYIVEHNVRPEQEFVDLVMRSVR